jgi:hypothetical protein
MIGDVTAGIETSLFQGIFRRVHRIRGIILIDVYNFYHYGDVMDDVPNFENSHYFCFEDIPTRVASKC